jgi:hypothetical protein
MNISTEEYELVLANLDYRHATKLIRDYQIQKEEQLFLKEDQETELESLYFDLMYDTNLPPLPLVDALGERN